MSQSIPKTPENIRDKGKNKSSKPGEWPNEGEGNKTADREYRKATEEFAKSGRVEEQARKAAEALDGDEGEGLLEAEEKGRKGNPASKPQR